MVAAFTPIGFLAGVAGFVVGWAMAGKVALPAAQGLFGFAVFAAAWKAGGPVAGAVAVGSWTLGTTVVSIPVFRARPAEADRRVIRAVPYRESMLDWLRTGRGPESMPGATVLAHLRETAVYAAAALLTANLIAIAMGAVLLNYMNAYVARLLRSARHRWTVRLLAWNVWSVIRVASFVLLGSALSAPLARVVGHPAPPGQVAPLLAVGGAGIVVDLSLKLLLSRPCGRLLARAVDLEDAARPSER